MKLLVSFFVRLFSFIACHLPRRVLRFTGLWAGVLWFDVLRFRRKIVLDNLGIAFPEWSEEKKVQVGRQAVYNMAYNFPELFAMPAMNEKWLTDHVVFEGFENLEKAHAKGKGAFLLTLHIGNGDVAANAIELCKYPVHMITKRFKPSGLMTCGFPCAGQKAFDTSMLMAAAMPLIF
jgi:KDO2-lipid IV(A) lauroyltransferase